MTENQPRLVSYERRTEYANNRQDSGRNRGAMRMGYSQGISSPTRRGSDQHRHHSNVVAPLGNRGFERVEQRMFVNGVEDHHFQRERRVPDYSASGAPDYFDSQPSHARTRDEYHSELEREKRPGPHSRHDYIQRINDFNSQDPIDGHPHYGFPSSTSRAFQSEPEPQETDILDDVSDAISDVYRPGTYAAGEDSTSESEIDDPEFLEIQERENIIKKYQDGPDGKHIDDWENPQSTLFKNKDRFGFLHKEEVTVSEIEDLNRRRIETEVRREKKWLRMVQQWDELMKNNPNSRPKKLDERIWKGIPDKWRMKIWPRLLNIGQYKTRPGIYEDLLLRARLVSKDIKQIDLDINRTYRDHEVFRRRYDVKQRSLLNVLAAYSMYNTEVGYCQGMSQIAALFLMYLDEEETFWCVHALMVSPRHTMHGFFVPGFPKLTRFEEHFKKVLKKYRPRVFKHLEKQDIPYIYLTKWWFGCFLDRVPFSLALRLWDVFLFEGDSILIAMAYNIMKMHEKRILKLQIDTFMDFIQLQLANDFGFSDDETLNSLRDTLTKLKSDRLHIPPSPKDTDLSEYPTKALGPILNKSIATIREELTEIQSRHSLAISNGRSPRPGRKKSKSRAGSQSALNSSMNKLSISDSSPHHRANSDSQMWKEQQAQALEQRRFSQKNRAQHGKPPISTNKVQNGFSQNSDRPIGRTSSVAMRDEVTGKTVTIVREDDDDSEASPMHRRDISTSSNARVTQSINHVTYITLGDDDGPA